MTVERKALLTALRRAMDATLRGQDRDAMFWIEDAKKKAVALQAPPLAVGVENA